MTITEQSLIHKIEIMKTKSNLFLICFLSFVIGVIAQEKASLTINVTNIQPTEGKLQVGLYNSAEKWLDKTFKGQIIKITKDNYQLEFKDIPQGDYAISIHHDKNGNGKFDMYLGMIPKEGYACSNDAKGSFGPPKWNDAKFSIIKKNQSVTVKF